MNSVHQTVTLYSGNCNPISKVSSSLKEISCEECCRSRHEKWRIRPCQIIPISHVALQKCLLWSCSIRLELMVVEVFVMELLYTLIADGCRSVCYGVALYAYSWWLQSWRQTVTELVFPKILENWKMKSKIWKRITGKDRWMGWWKNQNFVFRKVTNTYS